MSFIAFAVGLGIGGIGGAVGALAYLARKNLTSVRLGTK